MSRSYKPFIDGFWEKVDISVECWDWRGAERNRKHYGNYRGMLAHRVSWEIFNKREIPSGMLVMHKCDNPRCVKPEHLSLGDARENTNDMYRKSRSPRTKLN